MAGLFPGSRNRKLLNLSVNESQREACVKAAVQRPEAQEGEGEPELNLSSAACLCLGLKMQIVLTHAGRRELTHIHTRNISTVHN